MQTLTNPVKGLLLVAGMGVATPAMAELNPGSVMTKDGAQITPTLTTGISSNDNFFSTPTDEESRLIWTISPNVDALI
jgi:predicted alpha/beta hydrolase family esterase